MPGSGVEIGFEVGVDAGVSDGLSVAFSGEAVACGNVGGVTIPFEFCAVPHDTQNKIINKKTQKIGLFFILNIPSA